MTATARTLYSKSPVTKAVSLAFIILQGHNDRNIFFEDLLGRGGASVFPVSLPPDFLDCDTFHPRNWLSSPTSTMINAVLLEIYGEIWGSYLHAIVRCFLELFLSRLANG